METLFEIIKQLRAKGLTQHQVGAELGLSQAHISNIENGKRGLRTPADTLDRARSALASFDVANKSH